MTPDRARELLGGLSSGILTPEERATLFEAALHDQTLFNEVADELEFAAFLQSPETRAQLANRIEVEPEKRRWWALRPRWLALSGVLAASAVLFVAVWPMAHVAPPKESTVTEMAPPPPAVAQPPAANPATMSAPIKTESQTAQRPEPEMRRQARGRAAGRVEARSDASSDKALLDRKEANNQLAEKDQKEEKAKQEATNPRDTGAAFTTPPGNRSATGRAGTSFRAEQAAGLGGAPPATPRNEVRAAAMPPPPPPATAAAPPPAPMAPAPIVTATLEGTVRDASGAVVGKASVEIVNTATNTTAHLVADSNGHFVAGSLPPGGPYTVSAQAPGFKKEERSGIILAANQPAHVDLPLQVGSMAQTVEISAAAPMISAEMARTAQGKVRAAAFVNAPQQIAVLDFANGTPQTQSGQQAADLLSSQLLDSGQVRVIDREKVAQAWQAQQALSQSQAQAANNRQPNTKEAVALGRRVGADAVIVGSVKSGAASGNSNVAVTAAVIDTKKARQMVAVAADGTSLQGATNKVGLQLASQLARPLEGAVTLVDSGSVTVNFQAPGLPRIGARFNVYRGKRKIGELTVTSAYGQRAVGKFAGNGPPRVGDRVTSLR